MEIICPHCGSKDGFYTRERVSGTATIFYTNTGDYGNDQTQCMIV